MISILRHPLIGLLFLTTPLAACAEQAAAPAATATALPGIAQSSAPAIVTGLPDFTRLVEQVAPGVVNIEARATERQRRVARGNLPDDQIPEFFRRFFGPGFQFPGPDEQGPSRMPASMGSGFIISPDGYVLTNHHVVDGADEVKVKLNDRREFTAKVVGSDEQYDVALLKIDAEGLPALRLGDSKRLKPGQWAVAIGSPFGLDQSVTAGIISAVGRSNPYAGQQYVPFIQTDVAINRGNSGGPLLNTSGEVVGINSQIFSNSGGYMGVSFAIPIDLAMGAAEQIKKTGRVSRGLLGVRVEALDAVKAKGLGLDDPRGALVNEVTEGGAAAKAGLEVGDVIVAVNDQPVSTHSDLPPLIGAMPPGTRVKITAMREGKRRDFNAVLTQLEDDAELAGADGRTPESPAATPQAGEVRLLGVAVADLDADARRQLGLKAGEGVRVTRVTGGSAREAGLAPGMVILQVARAPVGSVAELNRELRGVEAGEVVMLLVRAGGATRFMAITAGEDEN